MGLLSGSSLRLLTVDFFLPILLSINHKQEEILKTMKITTLSKAQLQSRSGGPGSGRKPKFEVYSPKGQQFWVSYDEDVDGDGTNAWTADGDTFLGWFKTYEEAVAAVKKHFNKKGWPLNTTKPVTRSESSDIESVSSLPIESWSREDHFDVERLLKDCKKAGISFEQYLKLADLQHFTGCLDPSTVADLKRIWAGKTNMYELIQEKGSEAQKYPE